MEVPAGQLAQNKWMEKNEFMNQQRVKARLRVPEVINPDGGIDQDHLFVLTALRLRRGSLKSGIVPPRAASRFPASLAMR